MNTIIHKALTKVNDKSSIKMVKEVQGGTINEAYYIETEAGQYFLKYHLEAPKNFFELEKIGLNLIKETRTISVPRVLTYSNNEEESFIIMEWIEGDKTKGTESQLGIDLANLHSNFKEKHGFDQDTFIGLIKQPNGLFQDWLEYYRDKRLAHQIKLGIEQNKIQSKRRKRLEKLLHKLDQYIPQNVKPSYLHGDLWSGNWLVGPGGKPYLIDPSFLYGDRHFELAFTELFGRFPQQFYDSYDEVFPIEEYYKDVRSLYQLYYLLVHLNLFGETYGGHVDEVLKKYIG